MRILPDTERLDPAAAQPLGPEPAERQPVDVSEEDFKSGAIQVADDPSGFAPTIL